MKRNIAVLNRSEWNGFLLRQILLKFTNAICINCDKIDSDFEDSIDGCNQIFFHIDLTFCFNVPDKREFLCKTFEEKGILIANKNVTDISKRHIQDVLRDIGLNTTVVNGNDLSCDLLILKTNFNYGGMNESETPGYWQYIKGQYRLCQRNQIDDSLWFDHSVIIEKYITNSDNLFYTAYVMYDRLVISEVSDDKIIKKMPYGINRENFFYILTDLNHESRLGTLVNILKVFVDNFKLDFGSIDVVRDDFGNFYIIDVNSTPYWGIDDQDEIVYFLAKFRN